MDPSILAAFAQAAGAGAAPGKIWSTLKASGKSDAGIVMQAMSNMNSVFMEAGGFEPVAKYMVENYVDPSKCDEVKRNMIGTVIGLYIEAIPQFGQAVNQVDRNFIIKITNPLPKDERSMIVVGSVIRNIPGSAQVLISHDPQFGLKLAKELCRGSNEMRGSVAMTLGFLCSNLPQMAMNLCETEKRLPSIYTDLFMGFGSNKLSPIARSIKAIASVVPSFSAKFLELAGEKKVAARLVEMLNVYKRDKEAEEPADSLGLVGVLCFHHEEFASVMIDADKNLPSHLAEVLNSNSDGVKCQAAMAIGKIVMRRLDYAKTLTAPKWKIGSMLCALLSSPVEPARSNAAAAIARLVQGHPDFGDAILEMDPKVPLKLNRLLGSPDEKTQSNGCMAISSLTAVVPSFSDELFKINSKVHLKIVKSIESHSPEQQVAMACEALRSLVVRQQNFASTLLADAPLIGIKILTIAHQQCSVLGYVAAPLQLLSALAQYHPTFAKDFVASHRAELLSCLEALSAIQDVRFDAMVSNLELWFGLTNNSEIFTFPFIWEHVTATAPGKVSFSTLERVHQSMKIASIRSQVESLSPTDVQACIKFLVDTVVVVNGIDDPDDQRRREDAVKLIEEFAQILGVQNQALSMLNALIRYLK